MEPSIDPSVQTGLTSAREKAYAEITKRPDSFTIEIFTSLSSISMARSSPRAKARISSAGIDTKDPDGKLYIKERVELACQQSAFSQNYKWLNPATKEIEPQETYCERLDDIIVCGSVYNF